MYLIHLQASGQVITDTCTFIYEAWVRNLGMEVINQLRHVRLQRYIVDTHLSDPGMLPHSSGLHTLCEEFV